MKFRNPTPVFRFFHLDNLHLYLARKALHAPNSTPDDGRVYKTIHEEDNQNEIIYIGCYAQQIEQAGCRIVFSNGHGIMKLTSWYDSLQDLQKLDWDAINASHWEDTPEDPDRKRRKQAEFLVYRECSWDLVRCIGVINAEAKQKVLSILDQYDARLLKEILIRPNWYYLQ